MLRTFEDNFGVIFVSCVLEYVDDVESCIAELERVSGGSDLFVVTVSPYCLTAWLYGKLWKEQNDASQAKQVFDSAPPCRPVSLAYDSRSLQHQEWLTSHPCSLVMPQWNAAQLARAVKPCVFPWRRHASHCFRE